MENTKGKNIWHKIWRKKFKILTFLLLIGLSYLTYSGYRIYNTGHTDSGVNADCAIVLGAAAWHAKPSPVLAARLDHALLLYKNQRIRKLILTGGKGNGAAYAESEVALKYCLDAGVKREDIFIETYSLTTYENIDQAKRLMEQHGMQSALLVSDPWHLHRAILMASDQGVEAQASATQTSKYQSFSAKASFFCRELFYVQVYHLVGI